MVCSRSVLQRDSIGDFKVGFPTYLTPLGYLINCSVRPFIRIHVVMTRGCRKIRYVRPSSVYYLDNRDSVPFPIVCTAPFIILIIRNVIYM